MNRHHSSTPAPDRRDAGFALPLVLVLTTVIAVVVISLASFASTNLRFGRIAENRSDRLSAADAGMRYAIDQLKLVNAGCILDTQKAVLPGVKADFNGATAEVTCERITSGFDGIQAFAAVMTGEGLSATTSLLSSQSGSNEKVLGGPVYMARLNSAFALGPNVKIKDGPLFYQAGTTGSQPCVSVKASSLPPQLVFEPKLIFGPVCVSEEWKEIFDSPPVPDLSGLTVRDGSRPLAPAPTPPLNGSYTDYPDLGGCRVFEPGRYTTPPALTNVNAYFKTGDYVFDFPDAMSKLEVRQSIVTAGKINPVTTTVNEVPTTAKCEQQQTADTGAGFGATFYLAGKSHINVLTQGSLEIHARQQGLADYVSVQTLCLPNGTWCNATGGGGIGRPSTLSAPANGTTMPNMLFTDSGNNKEFVAHALVYAPLVQVEFGNVSNTATQKMLGGLIVSRLVLQSSTSATNFEIAVPTSPITARVQLTSVAEKDGETAIQAVVEYRPYAEDIDGRVRVNSWRVCETADCSLTGPPPPAATTTTTTLAPAVATPNAPCNVSAGTWTRDFGAGGWTAEFWNRTSSMPSSPSNPFSGTADVTQNVSQVYKPDGASIPAAGINATYYTARFTKSFELTAGCSIDLQRGSDDGVRVKVNGTTVIDDWNTYSYKTATRSNVPLVAGTNTIVFEFYQQAGTSGYSLEWRG